jgi:3-methyladenine DNA glycosylase AlkD
MLEEIRNGLIELSESEYRNFNQKIIPNEDKILGVRLPKLRILAKKIACGDVVSYLETMEYKLSVNAASFYYEEIMLYGLVIGYAKFTSQERIYWLERFVPYITSWGICDSCCTTYKWMKNDPEFWWDYLLACISRNTEYSIRFAIVCMLDYYINDIYIEEILSWCDAIHYEGYYVKMAVAWLVSMCYVKYPERTDVYLRENQLDSFTQNKAIQKICDSYKVGKEDKIHIKQYKR